MDRKKRRRSVRNLRRQSINSFSDADADMPCGEESLMVTMNDADDSVFGTVWVETQEESLKEKRKKRRSSALLHKPFIQLDTTSLEIEAMRADISEKSPSLVTVSPDIINSLTSKNRSPLLSTPDQTLHCLTPNNFDIAFLGVMDTSMKKVYPITPDVENDILGDISPCVNTSKCESGSSARKVYPVTPDVDEDVLALDSPLLSDSSPFVTPLTSRKNYPNDSVIENRTPARSVTADCTVKLIDSCTSPDVYSAANHSLVNELSINEQLEEDLTNVCNSSSKWERVPEIVDNSSEDKPDVKVTPPVTLSNRSDNLEQTQLLGNLDNKGVDFIYTHAEAENERPSESTDSNITMLISPTGLADSLDSIATGAMGLFNTLVRKISIKRGKSQKKTPKRLKSDKNAENNSHNENSEKMQHSSKVSLVQESSRVKDEEQTEDIDSKLEETADIVENDAITMETEDNSVSDQPSSDESIKVSTDDTMETQDCDAGNFNMTSLAESIDSHKENTMKTKRRSRRRSAEYYINCETKDGAIIEESEENNDASEEESGTRKSRRKRRASLDIYQSGVDYQSQDPPPAAAFFTSQFVKFTRPKKQVHENLEDLYMNKNYKAPVEKTWETIYESPGKTKQPNQIMSKKRSRRVIDFDGFAPAKFKRRLQKASNNGWDMTGKKHKILNDDFVKNKLSEIYVYLDTSSDS